MLPRMQVKAPEHGLPEDYWQRFGGLARMIGRERQGVLARAHVAVVGVGGVGSWVVEGLVRSGVGKLTLIDADDVCITNFNRQLPALEGNVGRPKVEVLAERARAISPSCQVEAKSQFFTAATAGPLLASPYDYLVDAIDSLSNKCLLLAKCREMRQPAITIGSAGERLQATQVRVTDLTKVTYDELLRLVRKKLRQEYGFPRESRRSFHLPAVHSPEPELPQPLLVSPVREGAEGCDPGTDESGNMDPTSRSGRGCDRGLGSAVFVTGVFGLAAAGEVVLRLLKGRHSAA